jgi:hypothetical protein
MLSKIVRSSVDDGVRASIGARVASGLVPAIARRIAADPPVGWSPASAALPRLSGEAFSGGGLSTVAL